MTDDHQVHSGDALADHHASDSPAVMPHGGADDHGGGDHGGAHGDDHAAEALGPIDVPMWTAAAVGILLGLVVMLAFVQAAA